MKLYARSRFFWIEGIEGSIPLVFVFNDIGALFSYHDARRIVVAANIRRKRTPIGVAANIRRKHTGIRNTRLWYII
jgi:hypothetical protein